MKGEGHLDSAVTYPWKIKSKRVFKFSGEGEVTNIFEYPKAIAAAMARPRAADLPRPK
jgi:hypothetical protein